MKVSSLFNLISDGKDLVDLFDGVYSQDQLISRLENLKHRGTEYLMECIEGLRASVTEALEDTLEMSAVLDDVPSEESNSDLDRTLEQITSEAEKHADEKPKPSDLSPLAENTNPDVQSES